MRMEVHMTMNFILQFNFETCDSSCRYYQVYVVLKSHEHPDFYEIENSVSSYYINNVCTGDSEYEDYVEHVMKKSGMAWEFIGTIIPESKAIHSIWV